MILRSITDLNDTPRFRDNLLQGIRSAVAADQRQAGGEILARTLLDTVVENAVAGRPLFSQASIWRGSKDPDVDSGTFDANWKHGSPSVGVATGYAREANAHIGFNPKSTAGFGVVARYDIDSSMRFHRNFGIEDGEAGKSIDQVEAELAPLVAALIARMADSPEQADHPCAEARAVQQYLQNHMYEASVPANLRPAQKWLSYPTGEATHGAAEFTEHTSKQLEQVAVSLVEARRLELDAHATRQALADMKQAKGSSLDDDAGRTQAIDAAIASTESLLRTQLAMTQPAAATLDRAIAERKAHQKGMSLIRLTNDNGRALSTGADSDRHVQGVAALCRDSRMVPVHEQQLTAASDTHRKLATLASTTSQIGLQGKLLLENGQKTHRNECDHKDCSRLIDTLSDKRTSIHSKMAEARSGLLNKIYYATLGKSQLAGWAAAERGLTASLRQQAERQSELRNTAASLSGERTKLETVRSELNTQRASQLADIKSTSTAPEIEQLTLASDKARIGTVADLFKAKMEAAAARLEQSHDSAAKLTAIARVTQNGMPLADAHRAFTAPIAAEASVRSEPERDKSTRTRASMSL